MTTAREIVYRALEDVGITGVGQTPLAEDMNFGLTRLNAMIGQWNRRRWLVYHTEDVNCVSSGAQAYTLGIGQQFNTPIVDKLEEGCFVRQYGSFGYPTTGGYNSDYNADYNTGSSGVSGVPTGGLGSDFNSDFNTDFGPSIVAENGQYIDYPLSIIESRTDWNRIAMKNMPSWPSFVFYDYANTQLPAIGQAAGNNTTYPAGYVYINPVPYAGQFEIHLNVKIPLATLTNLSTVLLCPPEYEEALEYNLALRFAAKYQMEASREVIGLARASLATIRSANNRTPLLDLPPNLQSGGLGYNIYSDRSY